MGMSVQHNLLKQISTTGSIINETFLSSQIFTGKFYRNAILHFFQLNFILQLYVRPKNILESGAILKTLYIKPSPNDPINI